jgi:uncharacterized tellurite resistance protein B-like protein
MDLLVTLPPAEVSGLTLKCNAEASFSPEVNAAILKAIHVLVADGNPRTPPEQTFLNDWASSRTTIATKPVAPDAQAKEAPATAAAQPAAQPAAPAEAPKGQRKDHPTQVREAMKNIRGLVKERDERSTVYKILFNAGIVSTRPTAELAADFTVIREILDLDAIIYSIVSDATIQAIPNAPYRAADLDDNSKLAIVAMSLIALNADNQKHVLEISAVKLTMMTLGVLVLDNHKIAQFTAKGIKTINADLPATARPAALLNALRLVVADNQILESEKQLVRAIATVIPPEVVRAIYKIVALECNKKFEI